MRQLLLLSALLFLVFACDEAPLPGTDDSINTQLQGSWSWVSSSGGIGGWTYEPTPLADYNTTDQVWLYHTLSIDGNTLEMRVDNDSADGLLIRRSTFEISEYPDLPDTYLITLSDNLLEAVPDIGGTMALHSKLRLDVLANNELVLSDDCADCFTHQFSKVD